MFWKKKENEWKSLKKNPPKIGQDILIMYVLGDDITGMNYHTFTRTYWTHLYRPSVFEMWVPFPRLNGEEMYRTVDLSKRSEYAPKEYMHPKSMRINNVENE